MTTHTGSCHCGKVAYQVEGEIDQVLDCNCSMCHRRGGLLWFVPRSALRVTSGEAEMGTYRFNTGKIAHHFCPECGISPFSEGTGPDGAAMGCINVRCLEGVDVKGLTVVPWNGRDH